MRILLVNRFFKPNTFGGATIVVENLAKKFAAEGHEVYVLTAHENSIGVRTEKVYRYEVGLVKVISLRLDFINHENSYENRELDELLEIIFDNISPDIVNLHAIQGIGIGVIKKSIQRKIPFHVFMHDPWYLCDRHFMLNYKNEYCGLKIISSDICKLCSPYPVFSENRIATSKELLEKASSLIVPSSWFADFIKSNIGNAQVIHVVPNGIEEPKVTGLTSLHSVPTFGYLGGIGPVKGSEILFKAFEQLTDLDFKFVIVNNLTTLGIGRNKLDISKALSRKIIELDSFKPDEIDNFYSQIDCLLFPSQVMETYGLAVREALLRKKWVITSACGGPEEAILSGKNGSVVPIGKENIDMWRDEIRSFINNPKLNSYKSDSFDISTQAIRLLRIFENSLND